MSGGGPNWRIVGQGLAGTCLAWQLWKRGEPFTLLDRGTGGSSRVAAGMINPVTGKNFEPSWRIADFHPRALAFYAEVEELIGRKLWHPHPVVRLAAYEKEWGKIALKLESPAVAPWVEKTIGAPAGWTGAVRLKGGGRLDTRAFMDGSRAFFREAGMIYQEEFVSGEGIHSGEIRCEGATGLLTGCYGPHRCAKGEILTLRATGWDGESIRIGAGGWLVPQGGGVFKVGSTYEWNDLDELPTAAGRLRVEEIAARLGGDAFEVIDHEAGIRPIMRRSQPLIGPHGEGWMFNGLGSKGSLYAPAMAAKLVDWMLDGIEPEPEVDFRVFLRQSRGDESS